MYEFQTALECRPPRGFPGGGQTPPPSPKENSDRQSDLIRKSELHNCANDKFYL